MNIFLLLRFGFEGLAPGHIVEFGSYRGGSALFMAKVCKELFPETKVYAFDTFEGMPETDQKRDAHRKGDFADTNMGEIQRVADKHGLSDNIVLVKGLFEDSAPGILPQIGSIRLNHIDCDIYSAVKYSYDCSIPYMVPGGFWVFRRRALRKLHRRDGGCRRTLDSARSPLRRAGLSTPCLPKPSIRKV